MSPALIYIKSLFKSMPIDWGTWSGAITHDKLFTYTLTAPQAFFIRNKLKYGHIRSGYSFERLHIGVGKYDTTAKWCNSPYFKGEINTTKDLRNFCSRKYCSYQHTLVKSPTYYSMLKMFKWN